MSSGNLTKIKEKLNAMRDAIELAEDRENEAKHNQRRTDERVAKAEEDIGSYKRRIELLTKELEKKRVLIQENKDSLKALYDKIDQEQATEKELGGLEVDTDVQLNDTEMKTKEAMKRQDEKLRDLNDVSRKVTRTELDLCRACDRADKADKRICEIDQELKTAGESMTKLESKDEEASEREGVLEEKIQFLENELKEVEKKAEASEREANKLNRTVEDISVDLDRVREKKATVENELNEILKVVEDDDI